MNHEQRRQVEELRRWHQVCGAMNEIAAGQGTTMDEIRSGKDLVATLRHLQVREQAEALVAEQERVVSEN